MNGLGEILKYELKKLILNKAAIISMSACICFLFGITMSEYLWINPEDRYVFEKEAALEGRALDEELLGEVLDAADEYGGLNEIPAENLYHHVGSYVNRLMGTYISVKGVPAEYSIETMTAEKLYQTREAILRYLGEYFCLSDEEKEYWEQKEAEIEKPFQWNANYGIWSMKGSFGAAIALAIMTIGVCLSGIFASERSNHTEDLIACTRKGRSTLAGIKMAAGAIFSLLAGSILLLSVQLPHILFNGFHGIHTPCQIILPFCAYPFSSGTLLMICTGIYMLACLLAGMLAMLLSGILKNTLAAAGLICAAAVLDLFLSLPPKLRILSQIRYLTPIQVLNNSSMADPRLLRIGEHFLTAYQSAALLYFVLTGLFCISIFSACKK